MATTCISYGWVSENREVELTVKIRSTRLLG